MHNEIEKWLNEQANDNPVSRAELARTLVKKVYDFVKFNRPEGEGLDGRDGPVWLKLLMQQKITI